MGFTYLRDETVSCGGQTHTVSIYLLEAFARALEMPPGTSDITCEFVLIPAGSFLMGSDEEGDFAAPVHAVAIGTPFLLARTEITQQMWALVVGDTGLEEEPSRYHNFDERAAAESVSWDATIAWVAANHLRLPTEAEWEYACRAGTTTRYNFGDDETLLDQYSWSGYTSPPGQDIEWRGPREVGTKLPNAFGLFDMHGNVWEWVQDDWRSSYEGAPSDGSAWGTGSAAGRVRRGGSWYVEADLCHSAYRNSYRHDESYGTTGLRPARTVN